MPDVAGVEPAVLVDGLGGGLGLVVVALHDVGAAGEDLAVLGDLDLDALERPAHAARPEGLGAVDGDDGAGLGEAVALEDQQAHGPEELGDLAGEGRPPGDEQAQPAARALADLREDELVGQRVLGLQQGARLRLVDGVLEGLPPHPHRPVEDLLLGGAVGGDLLLDARDTSSRRGGAPRHMMVGRTSIMLFGHLLDALGVGDGHARRRASGSGRPCARRCGRGAGRRGRRRQGPRTPKAARLPSTLETRLRWVSMTPLGSPVVPEV